MAPTREKVSDIQRYYALNQEGVRVNTHQLEYLVTTQLLTHHLKPASNVLELGAGPATYSIDLVRNGHTVTATDFSEEIVALGRSRLEESGLQDRVRLLVCDARDIESHVERGFDAITIFGPLYHLTKAGERSDLLRACFRLLKPEGLLFTAHITRIGLVSQTLALHPEMILNPNSGLEEFFRHGSMKGHPRDGSFRGYFTTLEEIPKSHTEAGFEIIGLYSQDPCLGGLDARFNELSPQMKLAWSSFLFRISGDLAALGSGRHVMCVCKK